MRRGLLFLFVLVVAVPAAAQNVHLAVIVGLAGDPEHGETFRRWAGTLVDGASERLGVQKDRIVYLLDTPELDPKHAPKKSTKEEIDRALEAIGKSAVADDVVWIVLIGHGSFDGKIAKFNLPGPDMTPADFAADLKSIQARQIVLVNTASSSAPFIKDLAGPGRTIVTATRTGNERFATLFGGFFVDALVGARGEAADADKNKRISVLEAFNAAKIDTKNAYEREGLMITEHPLLEDGGDGEGSADPSAEGKDGRIASILTLGSASAAEALPADPKLRQLVLERQELERRVEGLKLLKSSMDPAKYASELESLLTQLAVKSKEIREAGGKQP